MDFTEFFILEERGFEDSKVLKTCILKIGEYDFLNVVMECINNHIDRCIPIEMHHVTLDNFKVTINRSDSSLGLKLGNDYLTEDLDSRSEDFNTPLEMLIDSYLSYNKSILQNNNPEYVKSITFNNGYVEIRVMCS